ncbi:MAG: ArsR family transcriptional regulator [Rhodobacter sp. CACIA14H1]|nr:MAG: ArsR family transcriptional regulator [Rhodobacter sp. CACIA14H1]
METPFPHDPAAAERAVAMLKTLSHAGRLRILCHLIDGDMNVGELSDALHEPQASVSQHLMRLRAEGFVRPVRSGKHITYTLGREDMVPVIAALREGVCKQATPG